MAMRPTDPKNLTGEWDPVSRPGAYMQWLPLGMPYPEDARCIWKCVDCGNRCTIGARGHLDTHTHDGERCPETGKADRHVTPIHCTDCRDKPADEKGSGPCLSCGKPTRDFDFRVYFGEVGPFCCVPCRDRWTKRISNEEAKPNT